MAACFLNPQPVTNVAQLHGITRLVLGNKGITSLQANDFDGLINLEYGNHLPPFKISVDYSLVEVIEGDREVISESSVTIGYLDDVRTEDGSRRVVHPRFAIESQMTLQFPWRGIPPEDIHLYQVIGERIDKEYDLDGEDYQLVNSPRLTVSLSPGVYFSSLIVVKCFMIMDIVLNLL